MASTNSPPDQEHNQEDHDAKDPELQPLPETQSLQPPTDISSDPQAVYRENKRLGKRPMVEMETSEGQSFDQTTNNPSLSPFHSPQPPAQRQRFSLQPLPDGSIFSRQQHQPPVGPYLSGSEINVLQMPIPGLQPYVRLGSLPNNQEQFVSERLASRTNQEDSYFPQFVPHLSEQIPGPPLPYGLNGAVAPLSISSTGILQEQMESVFGSTTPSYSDQLSPITPESSQQDPYDFPDMQFDNEISQATGPATLPQLPSFKGLNQDGDPFVLPSQYPPVPVELQNVLSLSSLAMLHGQPELQGFQPQPQRQFENGETSSFPWITGIASTIDSICGLRLKTIDRIKGEFQCGHCHQVVESELDVETKMFELSRFIIDNDHRIQQLDAELLQVGRRLPCYFCGEQSAKPVRDNNARKIDWLYLLLGRLLGYCDVEQLERFCMDRSIELPPGNNNAANKQQLLHLHVLRDLYKQLVHKILGPNPAVLILDFAVDNHS